MTAETPRTEVGVKRVRAYLGGHLVADGRSALAAPLHGGAWHAYDDHRMATAGAIVGLMLPRVDIDDIGSTAKTMPEFPKLWRGRLA